MTDDDVEPFLVFREDAVLDEGAALDTAETEADFAALPRFLRQALSRVDVPARLAADCRDLAPVLAGAAARWADSPNHAGWRDLAAALDFAAAEDDRPALRGLADGVRYWSMTVADVERHPGDASRVVAALDAGLREADGRHVADSAVLARIERLAVGWSSLLAAGRGRHVGGEFPAHLQAEERGKDLSHYNQRLVEETVERRVRRSIERDALKALPAVAKEKPAEPSSPPAAASDGLVVCPNIDTKANPRSKDAIKGYEAAVGKSLPLIPTPDLTEVRRLLVAEFPYATLVVDRLLGPLVGRRHVAFPPILIVGAPGSGKTRLTRRFAECLGVGAWRTDGARADGNVFGGTDRRWHTLEPCHPFMACNRFGIANPVIIVDEIDKASTRSDYGRLWDCMLSFLEPESAARYPDPALQVDLDLSRASYAATANALTPLPSPLLDRFRVVEMPEPAAHHLDALVPPLMASLLADGELDSRWMEPLSRSERAVVSAHWRGGSIRRLRACLSIVMRARDASRTVQ